MIHKICKKNIGARKSQQDNVAIFKDEDNILMVLGDGMGGHRGGAVASNILIENSSNFFCGSNYDKPEEFFNNIISSSHYKIKLYAKKTGEDPHTTASFALIEKNFLHYGYIGDSRIYIFDEKGFVTRTRDDSVPEMLFQIGEIEEKEIISHPYQNRLTKSLGSSQLDRVFYKKFLFKRNKSYMIIVCSDGFWTQITTDEMYTLFDLNNENREKRVDEFISLSKKRAGDKADNISIALTKITKDKTKKKNNLLEKILLFLNIKFKKYS